MKDLESRLRKLRPIPPSPDLDHRVLAQKPEHPMQPFRRSWRVPVWATASLALVTAIMGFAGGIAWRSGQLVTRGRRQPPVMFQVIYDVAASRNPFDFTTASHFFPAEEVETTTRTLETKI